MRALLGCDYALHKLHCRIVLARIALTLLLDDHLAERARVLLKDNLKMRRRVRTHLDGLWLEAHRTERQFPSVMACNLELAVQVAGFSDVVALVYGTCQRYGVTVSIINFSCNLRFGNNSQEQEHQCNEKRPFHVCFILIYPIIDFEYTFLVS